MALCHEDEDEEEDEDAGHAVPPPSILSLTGSTLILSERWSLLWLEAKHGCPLLHQVASPRLAAEDNSLLSLVTLPDAVPKLSPSGSLYCGLWTHVRWLSR